MGTSTATLTRLGFLTKVMLHKCLFFPLVVKGAWATSESGL